MLVFASTTTLKALASSEKWHGDGTFKTSPKLFYQNYILFARYNKFRVLPCVYAFLTSKDSDDYRLLFSCIKEACEKLNIAINPKSILIDFEAAVQKAAKLEFPGIKVKGCFFHFCQAIYKKLVELGLKTLYSTNSDVKMWVEKLMALSLVPLDQIEDGLEYLLDE